MKVIRNSTSWRNIEKSAFYSLRKIHGEVLLYENRLENLNFKFWFAESKPKFRFPSRFSYNVDSEKKYRNFHELCQSFGIKLPWIILWVFIYVASRFYLLALVSHEFISITLTRHLICTSICNLYRCVWCSCCQCNVYLCISAREREWKRKSICMFPCLFLGVSCCFQWHTFCLTNFWLGCYQQM